MFKRSLFLSLVMVGGIGCMADDAAVIDTAADVAQAAPAVVAQNTPVRFEAVRNFCSSCMNSGANGLRFVKRMANPYSYTAAYNTARRAGWKNAAQAVWRHNKPAVAGAAVATVVAAALVAEYYFDHLISNGFKKAKNWVSSKLS